MPRQVRQACAGVALALLHHGELSLLAEVFEPDGLWSEGANMSLKEVAMRTAAKTYFKELAVSRALGYSGIDAYCNAMRAQDAVYLAAFEPERPWVWPRGSEPR